MHVVVTRPEPGTTATATRLAAMGHAVTNMPLTRLVDLPAGVDAAGRLTPDAYIATSAAALRATSAAIDTTRPIHVVGARTAQAARDAGFATIVTGPGDGAGLGDAILSQPPGPRRRYVYLAGRTRMPALEQALTDAGVCLTVVEVYTAEPVVHTTAAWQAALAARPVAVLLYSAHAARLLSEQTAGLAEPDGVMDVSCLCLNRSIASGLRPSLARNARVAERPDEDALFRLLT